MKDFIIITASIVDTADLAALHKVCFSDGLERPWLAKDFTLSLKTQTNTCFILKKGSQAVGYLLLQLVIDEAEIISFGIDPTHQRKGLASKLLTHLLQWLTERNVGRIILEVREDNYGAIYFYKAFRFEEIGFRKKYYKLVNGECRNAKILSLKLK